MDLRSMDLRSSKLIATFYVCLLAVVSLVVYLGYRNYIGDYLRQETTDARPSNSQSGTAASRVASASRLPSPTRTSTVDEQIRTIRQLRDLLDKRTSSLHEQNAQLQKKSAEFEELRSEADEYLALLLEVLQQDKPEAAPAKNAAAKTTPAGQATVKEDGTAPDAEKKGPSALELAVIRAELDQAQTRIVELEMSILHELELSSEASSVLVSMGAAAVPALTAVLADRRPELRRWAAMSLGRIGPDAMDADEALHKALQDEDVEVRSAAQWALKQIEDR